MAGHLFAAVCRVVPSTNQFLHGLDAKQSQHFGTCAVHLRKRLSEAAPHIGASKLRGIQQPIGDSLHERHHEYATNTLDQKRRVQKKSLEVGRLTGTLSSSVLPPPQRAGMFG